MPQNTSSAVMQQRREARDSLDDFPTPPWATRALVQHVIWPLMQPRRYDCLRDQSVWEPCVNRGHMARPLAEYFGRVHTSDVHDYSYAPRRAVWPLHPAGPKPALEPIVQDRVVDFLWPDSPGITLTARPADWIITNPPFRLAEQLVARAFELASEGVAIFVRSAFLEGQERFAALFAKNPPSVIAQFTERVVLHRGVLRCPDTFYADPVTGEWKRASSATSYCWLVWMQGESRTRFQWIPPCRKALEHDGDYPVNPDEKGVHAAPAAAGQGGLAL